MDEKKKKLEDDVREHEEEIKNVDLENFLYFDINGRYEYMRCEGCDGPFLGHLEDKCTGNPLISV